MGKSADVDEDVNRRAGLALRQPAIIKVKLDNSGKNRQS
jgi:hypothetical protein